MLVPSLDSSSGIAKVFKTNFKNFEFFNNVTCNTFQILLNTGHRKDSEIFELLKKYTNTTEFLILNLLYRFNSGTLTNSVYKNLLENNSYLKTILYFMLLLETLTWDQFIQLINSLDFTNQKNICNNVPLIILDTINKIIKIKNNFDLYSKGLISEGHFELILTKYKLNSNIIYIFNSINLPFNLNLDVNNLKSQFLDKTVGFFESLIDRYKKFSNYTTFNRSLGTYSRKCYHIYLKSKKRKKSLSYAERLAYKYLGKGLRLKFAKKWKNLRYRAYRIFLYTFKLKPFQLWQKTRKLRKKKQGGFLLDHLSFIELTIQNIMLLANFSLTLQEFREYLKNNLICIDGKIITSSSHIVKPFNIVHFIKDVVNAERDRFLVNLMNAFSKSIFYNQFHDLFEYNFTAYCFTMLPEFLIHKTVNTAAYYTVYNSGRFTKQKL